MSTEESQVRTAVTSYFIHKLFTGEPIPLLLLRDDSTTLWLSDSRNADDKLLRSAIANEKKSTHSWAVAYRALEQGVESACKFWGPTIVLCELILEHRTRAGVVV